MPMKLMLQSCFDVGYTLGFDENVFKSLQNISTIERKHGLQEFSVEAKDPPTSIQPPFGKPLRIEFVNLERTPVWNDWHAAAQESAHASTQEMLSAKHLTEEDVRVLKQLIADPPMSYLQILLYATGTAFVSLEFDFKDLPKEKWKYIEPFYRAYEWAGYQEDTSRHLLDSTSDIVQRLESTMGNEFKLTRRRRLPVYRDNEGRQLSNIMQAFTAVIAHDSDQQLDPRSLGFKPEVPKSFDFDTEGSLEFDWAFCVARVGQPINEHNFNAETVLYLLRTAYVIEHACSSLDILFRQQLQAAAEDALQDGKHPLEDLRRLVTIGQSIVGLSEPDNLTAQATQRDFFDAFENVARLRSKRERIKENAAALLAYREAEEARIQEIKDRRLNWVLFTITGLTLCSVAADILGEIAFPVTPIDDAFAAASTKGLAAPWLRRTTYIGAIVFPCLVAIFFFARHPKPFGTMRSWWRSSHRDTGDVTAQRKGREHGYGRR